jgi:hypothetical protein
MGDPIAKNNKSKGTGDEAQVIECLPSKPKDLSSNPGNSRQRERERENENQSNRKGKKVIINNLKSLKSFKKSLPL